MPENFMPTSDQKKLNTNTLIKLQIFLTLLNSHQSLRNLIQ